VCGKQAMASSETPSCHLRPLLTEKVRDEKADKGGKKGKKKKAYFRQEGSTVQQPVIGTEISSRLNRVLL